VVQVAECNIHNHKLGAVQDVVDVLPKKFTENEAVLVKFIVTVVNIHASVQADARAVHALATVDVQNLAVQKDAVDANVN
jgi:hypothetical protein